MTQSAWPFSGQTVSEAQFRAWARQAFGSAIYQGLQVSTSTTGRQLTVGPGLATVDGCAYMSDSTVTLDVDANTTGLSRRVYVVLRLDPAATPRIQLVTVNGPAGGGPASFTQTETGVYEYPLAYAIVTAGQTGGWSSSTSSAESVQASGRQGGMITETGFVNNWTGNFGNVSTDIPDHGRPPDFVTVQADPRSGSSWNPDSIQGFRVVPWEVARTRLQFRVVKPGGGWGDQQVVRLMWMAVWNNK